MDPVGWEQRALKALADEKRLLIIRMLSCGSLCACDLLAGLEISQPTLSYHMGVLVDSLLVVARQEGQWMHYSLDHERFTGLSAFIDALHVGQSDCIYHTVKRGLCGEGSRNN